MNSITPATHVSFQKLESLLRLVFSILRRLLSACCILCNYDTDHHNKHLHLSIAWIISSTSAAEQPRIVLNKKAPSNLLVLIKKDATWHVLHYKLHLFSRNATLRQNIMLNKEIRFLVLQLLFVVKCPHQSLKWHPPSESLLKALNASLKWFSGSWTHTYLCQVSTRCVVIDGHLIARFFLHKVVKGREVKDSSVVLVNVVDHILGKFQHISRILDASWFSVLCHDHGLWLTLWDSILIYFQQNQDDRTYIDRLTSWKS